MPIFANNIIVGGQIPPTQNKSEKTSNFVSGKITAKNIIVKNETKNKPLPEETPVQVTKKTEPIIETEEESRYIQTTDGDLIRHINKKSTYLRDMLELSK